MSRQFAPLPHYGFGPIVRSGSACFTIEALPASPAGACPYCGSLDLAGFGRRERSVADLPVMGRPLVLRVQTRRFRCKDCRRTFYEALPEIDPKRHMTLRLREWIGKETPYRSGVDVASEAGLSEGTIRQVLKDLARTAG